MCGARGETVTLIVKTLFPWEVIRNKNNLNKHPINSVNTIRGKDKYLH